MPKLVLHFFESSMRDAFIATCREMGIHGTLRTTADAPRHHVTAECSDEKTKKKLTEAWSAKSCERHG